jgi:hypothetical protein
MNRKSPESETGRGNWGKVENTIWEERRVLCFHVQSFEGGSPRMSRLRTALFWPRRASLIRYWCMLDLWSLINLVAWMVTESDAMPPYLQ